MRGPRQWERDAGARAARLAAAWLLALLSVAPLAHAQAQKCQQVPPPCGDHGTCHPTSNSYECYCEAGWHFEDDLVNNNGTCAVNVCSPACGTNATCLMDNTTSTTYCQCDPGFTGDGLNCTAVTCDPACSANAECVGDAVAGNLTCQCNPGFTGDGLNCTAVTCDPSCGANAECVGDAVAGNLTCECSYAYTGDGYNCTAIDACGSSPCSAVGNCSDTGNLTYTCSCPKGWVFLNGACADVDECAAGTAAACGQHATNCTNTLGGRQCACESGYMVDPVNGTCVLPRCKAGTCDSIATCIDLDIPPGTFCSCPPFYKLGADNKTCVPINPGGGDKCKRWDGRTCSANAVCVTRFIGQHMCVCNAGWEGDGYDCTDINECNWGAVYCDLNAFCTNWDGGYNCTCNKGFTWDGFTCTPDAPPDLCTANNKTCSPNAACKDLGAAGKMCVCNPGYSGGGYTCADIDECKAKTANCSANAACKNTNGSYVCTCSAGYHGDGRTCTKDTPNYQCEKGGKFCDANADCKLLGSAYACVCRPGFSPSPDGTNCTDVDECAAAQPVCGAGATCANKVGGYECTCNKGYAKNTGTCADVDECALGTHDCDPNARCSNTAGGFSCTCKEGYSGTGKACSVVVSLCAAEPCGANGACTEAGGGYSCSCRPGYSFDGRTCADVDECAAVPGPCHVHANCTNSPGGYACACLNGYIGDGKLECNVSQEGEGVNECEAQVDNCSVNAVCTDTQDGFECACKDGFEGDGVTCTKKVPPYALWDGVYYRHGELRPVEDNGKVVASADDCGRLCVGAAGCQHFTFDRKTRQCWLKGSEAVARMEYNGTVSGDVAAAPSVPSPGDPCNTTLGGAQVAGTVDFVSGQCVPAECQVANVTRMSLECQKLQCRWTVSVTQQLEMYSEACGGGTSLGSVKYNCLQLASTGAYRTDCGGATPTWAQVMIVGKEYQLAWVPIFQDSANGPSFFLDTCGATNCDYKQSPTFDLVAASMGHVTAADLSSVESFLESPKTKAAIDAQQLLPEITVYYHVALPKKTRPAGLSEDDATAWVTDEQLKRQTDLMNTAFGPFGFSFKTATKGRRGALKVDRAGLTGAKLYNVSMFDGGDGLRRAAAVVWGAPKRSKETGKLGNHVPTDLHIIVNRMPTVPGAFLTAMPWEIKSSDARDMRRPGAKRDMVVMDHDCLPGSRSSRGGGSSSCGGAAVGKPWEGHDVLQEIAHWIGLGDTFGVGDFSSDYSISNPGQAHICNPESMDRVEDTADHWCPTNGCIYDTEGHPTCHPQVGGVVPFGGGTTTSDPRCAGAVDYPDPMNLMNYFWHVGDCPSTPRLTAGQGSRLRALFVAFRVQFPYTLADALGEAPRAGQPCAQGAGLQLEGFDGGRGVCRTVTDCAASGGKSLLSWPRARGAGAGANAACDGALDSVQCCVPATCKAYGGAEGYCSVSEGACQQQGGQWLVSEALRQPCPAAGGAAGCCLPAKSKL